MKLYEYQAKEVFKESGIPIPKSILIHQEDELAQAIEQIGLPLVIKSQVLTGGRGKAGLISFVKTKEDAIFHVHRLFNHEIKIKSLLIEQAVHIKAEIYVSITVDPYMATGLFIWQQVFCLPLRKVESILRYLQLHNQKKSFVNLLICVMV